MEKSRYYKHINDKKFIHFLLLLVPVVGNIAIPLMKYRREQDKKRDKEGQRGFFKEAILGNENKSLPPKKIKHRPNQETHSVILTEANLTQYETGKEISQITGIDEALFQSLNQHRLHALLKRCSSVLIEIMFNEVPYYIPGSTLLSIPFFDRMLFGQFQESDGLTCTSHQL
ncbi:MAG: hypothetical protein QRY74_01560 [Chlamydia sp.]